MKKILKGNAVIGQSGGPTAAINATLSGVIRGAFEASCIEKIFGMRNGIEGLLGERLVLLNELASDLGMQISIMHEDIFNSMHRI